MSSGILNGNTFGSYLITASITPAATAAVSAVEQTFTVKGLKVGDYVDVVPPSDVAGVSAVVARVTQADTIGIKFVNPTAGSLTAAAGNYTISVLRPEGGVARTAIGD